mgnify:FL=1
MKIIDNAPMNKPCIGELIEERCAVGQFADNCIYLIADPESDIAKQAVDIMEQFKQMADGDDYYNTYELEVVQNVELKNHPKIEERIEQHGDNFLIQLASHGLNEKKRFIVAKTDNNKLFENINLMIYAAERITKFDITALLRSFAEDNTDEFVELARNAITDRRFQSNYFAALSENTIHPIFGMASSTAKLKEQMEIKGVITHKQRMEMYDRLLDNLKKSHKKHDPKMEAEIEFIIKSIDPATLRMFFQRQSPKLQEKMSDFVNPKHLAEVSSMDLEIRRSEKIDKTRKTDGYYRLFLCRDDERLMVHFSRSAGFVLYLIYLMDRKKNGDKVDTLNIIQYKLLFGKLYEMTYGVNGEAVFTDMVKNFNAKGELQQKGLYTVLKSIREDVGNTCERMQEPAEPFLLQDTKAHLAVLPKHIILPEKIMALI